MKKLLMTLLCSTALVLTGCSSQIKSADTQKKMEQFTQKRKHKNVMLH